MLRLYDPQTAAVTMVVPARRGVLRTYTACSTADHHAGPAGLRNYLLADLVRRVAERHQLQVTAWHGTDETSAAGRALRADWDALNIHPLSSSPAPPAAVDLIIGERPESPATRWLPGAPGRLPGESAGDARGPATAALAGRDLDPLALRLAFLQRPYREEVTLDWPELAAAGQLLHQWRAQVATWANSPSKPMCAQYTGDIKAAFDDDLDTPGALRTLDTLAADPEIPAGSKFETFAHLDHLLGLDLARDVGR